MGAEGGDNVHDSEVIRATDCSICLLSTRGAVLAGTVMVNDCLKFNAIDCNV